MNTDFSTLITSISDFKKEGFLKEYQLSEKGDERNFFSSKEQVEIEKQNVQIVDSLKSKAEKLF